jgi:hypothetical protein
MPRLPDDFLDSVFYLYPSEEEARQGINIGGSGFVVAVPTWPGLKQYFVYAVTNRHVLETADVGRFNTREGGTYIERIDRDLWVKSKTDDIAIRNIKLPPEEFAHRWIPLDMILSEEQAKKINLGIGDNVFMVGRFIHHEGVQRNAPLVRFGAIAQMPAEPIAYQLEKKRHEQYSIIADIRSIGGYSGSPVFLNEPDFLSRANKAEQPKAHYLIGVDWGHIPMWRPACGFNEEPIGTSQVNINSGMAGIVPSWKLLELLMEDSERRRKQIEAATAADRPITAFPDSAAPMDTANDANPTHREDFTRLVGAAARKHERED